MICEKCKKEYSRQRDYDYHINKCNNQRYEECKYCNKHVRIKNDRSMFAHYALCKPRTDYISSILTKDILFENLVTNNYTANYIALYILKIPEISAGHIIQYAKKYGIPTKTISEGCTIGRTLARKTYLEKYGTDNPSKNQLVKNKKQQTFINHYGVDNIFKTPEFKEQSKNTCLLKYGVEYFTQSELYTPNHGRRSKIHIKVESILDILNIKYISEVSSRFAKVNVITGKYHSPIVDILIDQLNIVIEVNGDMWHANPTIYKPDDVICTWGGKLTASDIWQLDQIRKEHIESFGFRVIYVWEYDILKNYNSVIEFLKVELSNAKNSKDQINQTSIN